MMQAWLSSEQRAELPSGRRVAQEVERGRFGRSPEEGVLLVRASTCTRARRLALAAHNELSEPPCVVDTAAGSVTVWMNVRVNPRAIV